MAINDIVQTIAEARFDARSLSEFVFKPASFMVARRLAPSVHTLQYYVNRFETIDSSFTQALNTANAAAVTATNNAVGLIDSVTNNAYNQVSSAIDGVAIDANLVTDALITTSIRHSGQVVRTQAQKNDNSYYIEDWGGVADGVTDNHPILMQMIEDLKVQTNAYRAVVPRINFKAGHYYFSDNINLHAVVHFVGETSVQSVEPQTYFIFPQGKDGIIVNRFNTDGAKGTISTILPQADGSRFEGIGFGQKGYVKTSCTVCDYNTDDNIVLFIGDIIPNYTAAQEMVAYDERRDNVTFSGTLSNKRSLSHLLYLDLPVTGAALGATVTGSTSGATGTLGYISQTLPVYIISGVTGTFTIGEQVSIGSGSAKLLYSKSRPFIIADLTTTSGVLKPKDILFKPSDYGSAIVLRARAAIRDCSVLGFAFNGLQMATDATAVGNVNTTSVDNLTVRTVGHHGVFVIGGDSNACKFTGLNINNVGGYGVYDRSFLGNHYFSCHTSMTPCGAYFSSDYNNFSLFAGCYSEAGAVMYPLPTSISQFGRETTIIGGDHGGEIDFKRGYIGSSLIGSDINFGKALFQTQGKEATGQNKDSLAVMSSGINTISLSNRYATVGQGATFGVGIGTYLSYGSQVHRPDLTHQVNSGGIYSQWYARAGGATREGSVIKIKTLPAKTANGGILFLAQSPASGGRVGILRANVIEGNLVSIDILDSGDKYTDGEFALTFQGEYAGGTGTVVIMGGTFVATKISQNPTNQGTLTNTTPIDAMLVTYDAISAGLDTYSTLGTAAIRFKDIYAATGAINTSDAREKTEPQAIPDTVLDAWGDVSLVTYKWLASVADKGDDARTHIGIIAQSIRDAFASRGLDATEYGLLCYDKWDATPAVKDKDGNITTPAIEAGDRWGVRFDQCLFLEAAYQRRGNRRIIERLEVLETK